MVWAFRRDPWSLTLVRLGVLAEAERSAPAGRWAPPRWRRQLDGIARDLEAARESHRPASDAPDPVDRLVDHLARDGGCGAELMVAHLAQLRPLAMLEPEPSSWPDGPDVADGAGAVPTAVLDRVRALLAKAESTDHPPEAEAFTAKAQELIARHALDAALVAADDDAGREAAAVGRRLHLARPYVRPKAVLVHHVARANRCRVVIDADDDMATVFGHPADLDAVELVFTSLLVQATSAMLAAGSQRDAAGRSRTRGFRSSFLNAYGARIGERLEAADRAVTERAATDGSAAALPVLARRDDAALAAVREHFPRLGSMAVTSRDWAGVRAGRAAADRADLGGAERLRGGARPTLGDGTG